MRVGPQQQHLHRRHLSLPPQATRRGAEPQRSAAGAGSRSVRDYRHEGYRLVSPNLGGGSDGARLQRQFCSVQVRASSVIA